MMNLLSRFFRRRPENGVEDALSQVRSRLEGCVSSTVLAQAQARVMRRIGQGCAPAMAAQLAVTWALSAHHAEVSP